MKRRNGDVQGKMSRAAQIKGRALGDGPGELARAWWLQAGWRPLKRGLGTSQKRAPKTGG